MTAEFLVYLTLGAAAGGFINGLSGTGTALFALGFYLVVLDPVRAVAICALMSVLVGVQGLWIVRREIRAAPKRLLRFLLPGIIGVPIGVSLLTVIEAGSLRVAVATLLILYGGYFAFRTALPAFDRSTPVWDMLVGFVGGVLGGSASVSGAIPAMWISLRPWRKTESRAVLQPFNVLVLSMTVALIVAQGGFDRTALMAFLVTLPMGVIAAQVGIWVFRRLTDTQFRRLVILLTLLMGLGIMLSEVV